MSIAAKRTSIVSLILVLSVSLMFLFPGASFAKHAAGTKTFHGSNYFTYSQCKNIVNNVHRYNDLTGFIAAAAGLTKSRAGGIIAFTAYIYGWSVNQKIEPFKNAVKKHKGVYIKYTYYLPPVGPGTYGDTQISYR